MIINGMLARLHAYGKDAVAGFNSSPPSPVEPQQRLTTVMAPWMQIGEVAVDRPIEMCRGE